MRKKEKAVQEKNHEQIYNYCKELADVHNSGENYELALAEYKVSYIEMCHRLIFWFTLIICFQQAEKAAKKLNNKMYIAKANRMIGEMLCNLGEFEKAIEHGKIHLSEFRFHVWLLKLRWLIEEYFQRTLVKKMISLNSKEPLPPWDVPISVKQKVLLVHWIQKGKNA